MNKNVYTRFRRLLPLFLLLFGIGKDVTAQTIYGFAGVSGTPGFSGDGGPAISALMTTPREMYVDGAGNVYFDDLGNNRIRKVNTAGIISTVAGNGSPVNSGDGGPAISAGVQGPAGVVIDNLGNMYISVLGNVIRKVDASGIISTVIGTGVAGFSGDGGPATDAQISRPLSVKCDAAGNIYFCDKYNDRIRRVDAVTGIITTVAGGGTDASPTYSGPGTGAKISAPNGMAIDALDNVYFTDSINKIIRKYVPSTGMLTTVAGNTAAYVFPGGDGGPALSAQFDAPARLACDVSGNVYVADQGNDSRVREIIVSTGMIYGVAGDGTVGDGGDGGPAISAALDHPAGMGVDNANNFYIADRDNNRIRRVCLGSTVASTPTIAASANPICRGSSVTLSIASGSLNNSVGWSWYSGGCGTESGGVNVGTGTSVAVTPTVTTTYYARGEGGCAGLGVCGSIIVTVNPLPGTGSPTSPTYLGDMTGGGAYCAGGLGVIIGLESTQVGVSYQLYQGSTPVGSPLTNPAGEQINFGYQTAPGTYEVLATRTSTGCHAYMATSLNVTVTTPPDVAVVANQTDCNGALQGEIDFTGSIPGTSFTWTNSNTSIGLGAGGTSGTICGTADEESMLTMTAPAGAVFTSVVYANYGDNYGSCGSFVNYCGGANAKAVVASYLLGKNTATIPVNNGTFSDFCFGDFKNLYVQATYTFVSNVPSFTAINPGTSPTSGVITVTPYANGCKGTPETFNITVNPTPDAGSISGTTSTNVGLFTDLSESVPGGTWSSSNPSVATIDPATGVVGGAGTGTATITYTVTSLGCTSVATANVTVGAAITSPTGCCLTNSLTINTGYDPTTGTNIAPGGGSAAVPDPHWTVTAVSPDIITEATGAGYTVTPIGSAADVVYSYTPGGISCVSNWIYPTISSGTYTSTYARTFTLCSDACVTLDLTISSDDNVTGVHVDGGANLLASPTLYAVPTHLTTTCMNLTGGMHTISVDLFNYPYDCPTCNAQWLIINGTVSCSTSSIIGEGAGCTGYTCALPAISGPTSVCSGSSISLSATSGGLASTSGSWTSSDGSIATVDASGNVTGGISGNATISYADPCGRVATYDITVNPLPIHTAGGSYSWTVTGGGAYCAGGSGAIISVGTSQSGVNYQLYLGGTMVGSPVAGIGGPGISFGYQTAAGTYSVIATDATTGCYATMPGSPAITINPIPTVDAVANQVDCNGGTQGEIDFTGSVTGTSYSWTNSNSAIGLGAGGATGSVCATASEGGVLSISAPPGAVFTSVDFASYGTPGGSCGGFSIVGCNAINSMSVVQSYLIGNNSASIPADNNTFTDPCYGTPKQLFVQATYTFVGNIPSFTATNPGGSPISGTITVTPSANGCTGSPASFNITVKPTTTMSAVADISQNTDPGNCSAVVTYAPVISAATSVSYVFSGATVGGGSGTGTGLAFNTGNTTVTITAVGDCNTVVITFNVTVTDHENPAFVTPSPVVVCNDHHHCSAHIALATPTVTDNCGVLSVVSDHPSAIYPVGTTTVTWTATDIHGNTSSITQSVTVNDCESPEIEEAPHAIVVCNNPGTCGANIPWLGDFDADDVSDNCGIASITNDHPSTFYPVGTTVVTWTVTDIHGNATTVTQNVKVKDCEPPHAVCHSYTLNLSGGAGTITPANVDGGSWDNCGIASMSVYPNTFTCADAGIRWVTLTVTDVNGNISHCTSAVTIQYSPVCSISVTPGAGPYTGGVPTTIYLGYGPASATLTASVSGGTGFIYSWTATSGLGYLSDTHVANPVFTPTLPGHYTYVCTITNSNGCTTSCSVSMCVIDAVDHRNKGKVILCHGFGCSPSTLSLSPSAVPAHLIMHCGYDHLGPCGSSCSSEKESGSGESAEVVTEFNVTAFPNPFENDVHVKIESNATGNATVTIYDITGRVRDQITDQPVNTELVIGRNLTPGMYILEVSQGDNTKKIKLVKYQ